jgi:hypothetical protein
VYTASSLHAYCAFATTFKALKANFFCWEKILQLPGCRHAIDESDLVHEEFVAEEIINHCKGMSASEGVNTDDKRVKTFNAPLPPQDEEPSKVAQQGPLTFDPSLLTGEGEDIQLVASVNQTELMRWHYRLGHQGFSKLKQLALNGKIPKKLTKVLPPKCAGCLLGAMTKLPWQSKETKADHKVFIATKPGECASINQMTSTEVGFYKQLKGKLTKKRYKYPTMFVNNCSHLHFVHLQLDNSLAETLPAKLAFKQYVAGHRVKFSTITATTGDSMTMPSNRHATMHHSNSTFVA